MLTDTDRTFYLPSSIPTGGSDGDAVFDMTARESRINFKAQTQAGDHTLGMVLELDFLTTGFGNEAVSNSTSPRLRHYFLTYDNWLFGQTWSTFMDTAALPEALDFLGAPEGTVFIRQPMIRYSWNGFQIALENPETFTDTGVNDDNSVPDITANYKLARDWGHLRLNGLFRELKYEDGSNEDSTTGWGVGVSGKVKVDNPSIAPGSLNESANSIQVNLMYNPIKPITLGVMYLKGELEKENGDDGELERIQFAAKYSF